MLYTFNYSKLIGAVSARGLSSGEVAKTLGISENQYLLKLSNLEEFTQYEIRIFAEDVLYISPETIPEYFFCRKA